MSCGASPFCPYPSLENGFCFKHQDYASAPIVKKKYEIPKVSSEQKEIKKQLAKEYPLFLALPGNGVCHIKSPVCTGKATTVNHKKRRGKLVLVKKYWQPCCFPCNGYVEIESAWAYEHGHLIKVHETDVPDDDEKIK